MTAPIEQKTLVVAGPGAGKTHVLVARLANLTRDQGARPGSEILVLTFSRAAAREIRHRLQQLGGPAAYATASTFDSFATRLAAEVDPGGSWTQFGYDERIRFATDLVRADPTTRQLLAPIRHVMIDEIQDLVSERLDFVTVLLEATSCGFTLLGDPAQGIYTFGLEPEERAGAASAVFDWSRCRFGPALVEAFLTGNHRARTDAAAAALAWGPHLSRATQEEAVTIREELDNLILRLPTWGTLPGAVDALAQLPEGTAVLCRTNGQALVLSKLLQERGVLHAYQHPATDRIVPPWIAAVLAEVSGTRLGRSRLEAILARRGLASAPDASEAWSILKRLDGGSGPAVDCPRLLERLRVGRVPDDIAAPHTAPLVVSTIHRAKGLEFDCVVLVEPPTREDEEPTLVAEEARVLYVALTRPRKELYHVGPPNVESVYRHERTDRWIRRRYGWQLIEIEVRGEDSDGGYPLVAEALDGAPADQVMDYILSGVRVGDPVSLELIAAPDPGAWVRRYRILHGGRCVGVTSEGFGRDLFYILKLHPRWQVRRWPGAIDGLTVEALDSVATNGVPGQGLGLGVWTRVRASGFGSTVFS